MRNDDEEWQRYFDEENNAFYLYNNKSGESKWDTNKVDNYSETNNYSDENLNDGKDLSTNSVVEDSYESDEDENSPSIRHSNSVYNRSIFDPCKFDVPFIILNGILLEAPLCLFEGILRCVANVIIIVFQALGFLFVGSSTTLYACMEDLLFTSMVLLTLLIPGTICFIYRNYFLSSSTQEWEIAPLPTLIGWTDMRRFSVITFGFGGYAANIDAQYLRASYRQDSLWEWIPFHFKKEKMILIPIEIYSRISQYIQSID
mmetsp:Transcript_15010/g.20582  ORF Transcript_15010/g.20582 Transcript_15010/m.20582 type:complete len:259 (+) Transcript_15010:1936-2712(+)